MEPASLNLIMALYPRTFMYVTQSLTEYFQWHYEDVQLCLDEQQNIICLGVEYILYHMFCMGTTNQTAAMDAFVKYHERR